MVFKQYYKIWVLYIIFIGNIEYPIYDFKRIKKDEVKLSVKKYQKTRIKSVVGTQADLSLKAKWTT